jgi:hypothetical protein
MLLEEASELKTIEILKSVIGNIIAQWKKNERTSSG